MVWHHCNQVPYYLHIAPILREGSNNLLPWIMWSTPNKIEVWVILVAAIKTLYLKFSSSNNSWHKKNDVRDKGSTADFADFADSVESADSVDSADLLILLILLILLSLLILLTEL